MDVNTMLRSIANYTGRDPKEFTYVILGRTGPTGKTYTCTKLRELGYNAVELTEQIYDKVDFTTDRNYIYVDRNQSLVTIILNKSLTFMDIDGERIVI